MYRRRRTAGRARRVVRCSRVDDEWFVDYYERSRDDSLRVEKPSVPASALATVSHHLELLLLSVHPVAIQQRRLVARSSLCRAHCAQWQSSAVSCAHARPLARPPDAQTLGREQGQLRPSTAQRRQTDWHPAPMESNASICVMVAVLAVKSEGSSSCKRSGSRPPRFSHQRCDP